jgi:hypothetical protein
MDRDAAEKALVRLARQSAATWQRIRGQTFRGDTTIETANTLYRFKDGVFAGRAPRLAPVTEAMDLDDTLIDPAWESPPGMAGLELIGFLADEEGLWSLSPRWRPGALAVMWRRADAAGSSGRPEGKDDGFTLTSPTLACTIERPREVPPPNRSIPERSDVFTVPSRRPPTVRRPAPDSMTRLQPVPPSR